jgi:hypothetical protein
MRRFHNVIVGDALAGFRRLPSTRLPHGYPHIHGADRNGWQLAANRECDELVWECRYCDEWNKRARFDVLFDGSKEVVRSAPRLTESQMGLCGPDGICVCGHAK